MSPDDKIFKHLNYSKIIQQYYNLLKDKKCEFI